MSESSWTGALLSQLWNLLPTEEIRQQIWSRLADLRSWFRGEVQGGILVLGAGGTGKSTLARILSGTWDYLVDGKGDYLESLNVEEYKLRDSSVEVAVPPGQRHRRPDTWPQLLADVAKGVYRGIALVNAFGYHSIGETSVRDLPLFKSQKTPAEFLQAYLIDRRREEVEILRELANPIATANRRIWLVSAVTKKDLWCPQQADVEEFYRDGEYGRELHLLRSHTTPSRLRHEWCFTSLAIRNFVTGKGELLKENVAGFDQASQVGSLHGLLNTFDALRKWEETE